MDFYKTLRHPKMATPKYTGFEWPHKLFADGKPRAPWDFITEQDSKEILDGYAKSYLESRSKILEDGFLKGKIVHTNEAMLSIQAEKYCERFKKLDAVLQDYGQGVNCKIPFNNPLGAPVAAIKTSVTASSAVVSLLIMVYIPDDKKYYRAKIAEIKGPNELMVCIYDKALREMAKLENIYYLPHRFDFSITPAHVFKSAVFNMPTVYRSRRTFLQPVDRIQDAVATILEHFLITRHFSLNRTVHFRRVVDAHIGPYMFGIIAYPLETMMGELRTFLEEMQYDQLLKQKSQDLLQEMSDDAG